MSEGGDRRATPVTYCERWNSRLRKPVGPMPADQARARDRAGEPYTVILGEPARPDALIEVAWKNDHLGVWFFDDRVRRRLKYSFTRVEGRLFLREVTSWESPPEAKRDLSDATVVDMLVYQRDGTVRRRVDDKAADEVRITEYADVPLDLNWEHVPEFGDWAAVARQDRARSLPSFG